MGANAQLAAAAGWEKLKMEVTSIPEVLGAIYRGANSGRHSIAGELGSVLADFSDEWVENTADSLQSKRHPDTLNEVIAKVENQILNHPTRTQIIDFTPYGGSADIKVYPVVGSKGTMYEVHAKDPSFGYIPTGDMLSLPEMLAIAKQDYDEDYVPRSERPSGSGSILELPERGGQRPWFQRTFTDRIFGSPQQRARQRANSASEPPNRKREDIPEGANINDYYWVSKKGWLTREEIEGWNTTRPDIEEMKLDWYLEDNPGASGPMYD